MTDLSTLSAAEIVHLVRAGKASAAAVMEACLARIAERDMGLRAMAHCDRKAAMEAAEAADRRARDGIGGAGPLHGVPFGVKDVIDVAGLPTGYNSPIWEGYRPAADAAVVALARRAGAVVAGKTVTAEFAARSPGPTRNPHDPGRTPGGSSSGSAAGVAGRYFPVAVATQTAGSIVRPASYCGVVGYKPTVGTVHRGGMRVFSETLDTIGVMARTVADCALFVSATMGIDLGDPDRKPGGPPRLAFTFAGASDKADAAVRDLMERTAGAAAKAGAHVTEIDLPAEVLAAEKVHRTVMYMEGAQALAWEMSHAPERLSTDLRERLEKGSSTPYARLAAARDVMAEARRRFAAVIAEYDAIVTPSATGEAPAGLHSTGDPSFNLLWSALRVPCVSVPAGPGPLGLPLGLQVVAGAGADREVLSWARWVRAVAE